MKTNMASDFWLENIAKAEYFFHCIDHMTRDT